jgi:hypothetical protein
MRALMLVLLVAALLPCDLALDNPGGSKAGSEYVFTVMSSTLPVKVAVTVGGETLWTGETNHAEEKVTITLPESARGKTVEIAAENKDGCVVTWSETVQ